MQHIDRIELLFRASVHLVRARLADDSFPALKDARTHKKFFEDNQVLEISHIYDDCFLF